MTRVLLVEDDAAIADPLARALKREGYDVEVFADGPAAITGAEEGADLVVLDLGLPGMDGLEVCRQIRAGSSGVPVLILTARAEEVDTVVGLDAGADDYVTKPFRLAELLARVRALLRRGGNDPDPDRAPAVRIDQQGRRAFLDDKELQLTAKEFDVLRVLVREAGKVVPREQLLREVWAQRWLGSTKTLDMHVSWLRRKLGDDVANPHHIKTVRGVGFRFERGD
jgi:DNA-binding response OmpR family regulator